MKDIDDVFPGNDSDKEKVAITGSPWVATMLGERVIRNVMVWNYSNKPLNDPLRSKEDRLVEFTITRKDIKRLTNLKVLRPFVDAGKR